jgi:hypothetical protein
MALSAHKQFPVTNLVMYFDPANRKSYSSGTAITDLSSARNNGVLTNGPTFTNILGGYITLDGTNDCIEITRTGDFNVSTNNACCCLWFRANVINAGNALIFSNYKTASSLFNIYQLSSGKVAAYFRDSSSNVASMDSMNNLSDGRWHFICAQRTGTTTFELYVDGQIDNSTTTANISNIDLAGASNITIGVLGGLGQQFLNGDVGAVWYYSSSLTAAQINQIYQSTKSRYSDSMPTVRRGLIMDLDASNPSSYAGVGTVWYDISGNNYHCTLYNSPSYVGSGSTAYFLFDGTNDYGYVPITPNFSISEATYLAWIYPNNDNTNYDGIIFERGDATGMIYGEGEDGRSVGYGWNGNSTINTTGYRSAQRINPTSWNQVVLTIAPTEARFYVNNKPVVIRSGSGITHNPHTLTHFHIAQDPILSRIFGGRFSKAMVYDRALSGQEIAQNYRVMKGRYHNVPQENLVLNLEFYNKDSYPGTGTSIVDVSGSMLIATASNGPVFSNLYGGMFTLDGVDDTIVTSSLSLANTNKVSICFWAKLTNYTETTSAGKILLEFSSNYNSVRDAWVIGYAEDSSVLFSSTFPIVLGLIGNSNGYNFGCYNKTLVNDLRWHFWTCIFDTSQSGLEVAFYLDGILRTPAISYTVGNNSNNFGNYPVYISNRAPGAFSILDLHIYNGVLSATDVKNIYDSTRSRYGK